MTRDKNIDSRKNAIITLATANDYKSIPELSKLIDKKFQTINNYFKEIDISNLIESKQFNNPTVNGIKPIKYKFKSGLENLLAVFDYLETKQYQKKLMKTDYYKSFIPEIGKIAKEDFRFTDSDYQIFEIPMLKEFYNVGIKYSPSFVYVLLKIKSDKSEFFEKISAFPPSMVLYYVLYGVLFYDAIEGIIDDEEFPKFQILGLS
jgi:hypothetical protein